ncbi:MAG: glycosyltransferase family 4 protein [Nitrososphaerota archaeon]|nr:glycosyltransferase family 4 protein [Nitrososphaerota archaeon]
MGKDIDLFADYTDTLPWDTRSFDGVSPRPLTRPTNLSQAIRLMKELDEYDRILIHHHVEPVLAYLISRYLRKKVAWYSGSIFEPAYSELLYGEDYKNVSATLDATTRSFYGRYIGRMGLAAYPAAKTALRILDLKTVKNYHKIITNSDYQARYVLNIYRRTSTVVYPPLEDNLLTPKKLELKLKLPYVLMAGAFVYYKNFKAGIKAMDLIKDAYSLVMVGSGMLRSQYEQLARESGVSLSVHYGSSDEVMHYLYDNSSFVIHPSLFEGFGFIAAEAALHQKPTILTTHSGVREFFKDGESAYICDPFNIPLMQERARRLANHPEQTREMGRKAHDSIACLSGFGQSKRLWEELENW